MDENEYPYNLFITDLISGTTNLRAGWLTETDNNYFYLRYGNKLLTAIYKEDYYYTLGVHNCDSVPMLKDLNGLRVVF